MPIGTKTIITIIGVVASISSFVLFILIIAAIILYTRSKKNDDNTSSNYIMIEGTDDQTIPDSQRVIVYGSDAYENKLGSFLQGKYIFTQNADNKIKSLQIPVGYEVHLFDDNNFKKELAVYKVNTVLPIELRNLTSSLAVTKV